LGEGQDLGQPTDNDHITLSAFFSGDYFDVVDERPDNIERLWPSSLVTQDFP
jgi:hypothetical protein